MPIYLLTSFKHEKSRSLKLACCCGGTVPLTLFGRAISISGRRHRFHSKSAGQKSASVPCLLVLCLSLQSFSVHAFLS